MRIIVRLAAQNYRLLAVFVAAGLAVVFFRPASGTTEQRAAELCAGAEAAIRYGDDESAIVTFREAVGIHAESVCARLGLGVLLAGRRRFDEATEILKAISPALLSPPEWIEYARALRDARADSEAETAYLTASARMPKNPRPALELAEFHLAAGKLDNAESQFRRAGSLGGDRGVIYAGLGRVFFSRGQLDSAAVCFRLALREDPADVDLLCDTARNELRRKRPRDGLRHVRRAVALDPYRPRARYLLGRALLALGHEKEARTQLNIFDRQNRLADRIRVLEHRVAENPTAEAYQALSHLYSLTGRDNLASLCLQRATALNPLVTAPHEAQGAVRF